MNINIAYSFLLLLFSCSLYAQTHRVEGTVTSSEDGEPLIGVAVQEKGTTRGGITDFDGQYSIEVSSPDATIVFSYIGTIPQEVEVDGRSTIDVVLEPESKLLDEVVVVGYESQTRSRISGAVSSISTEDITDKPILRAEQALQGQTAGVQVAQVSGSPGSPLTVRVRGISTINNSDPLYIVDGIPVEGIDYLNPQDIKSISVLKDAASAAIYGARGGNGVVIITTKSGKREGEGQISYSSYYGTQSVAKTMDLLNGEEYATLLNEARINGGLPPLEGLENPQRFGEGTDWQEAIFEPASMQSHQLSFQGGSKQSSYRASGSYFNQDGIVGGEKSGFERYTASLATDSDIKDWLTAGSNLNFTYLQRNFLLENNEFNTPLLRALNMDPVTPVYKPDGTYAYSEYVTTDLANPVNQIEQTFDTWTTHRVVGSVFGEAHFLEHFSIKSTLGIDATFAQRDIFNPIYDLSIDPDIGDAPTTEVSDVNTVTKQELTWRKLQWENYLTYKREFGDHTLSTNLGNTVITANYRFLGGANTGLPSNDPVFAYIANTIDQGASNSAGDAFEEEGWLSYFGRINYSYKGRYIFTHTSRVDGSSRFGPEERYGYFPSFSGGWLLSEEGFWGVEPISVLKLRASWGRNGNDRIGNYGYTSRVLSGQNYTFGPDEEITNGSAPVQASNPELKWETNQQFDVGIDLEFKQGRFELVADYFVKKTLDMLYAVDIPAHVGIAAPVQNIGNVKTEGLELSLAHRGNIGGVGYNLRGNFTTYDTEITSLGGGEASSTANVFPTGTNVVKIDVGLPIGGFWGFETDGIFQNQQEVNDHAFQNENTAPGDIRFRDLNGDGIIDDNDKTLIGDPNPDFLFGLDVGLNFRGFDLSAFAQGTYGNDIFNGIFRYDFPYSNRHASALNRWHGPGTSNTEPRVNVSDPNQNARASDRYIEDGSYLRLKSLQLGYSLPQSLTGNWGMSKLRVYATAYNLLTLTDYTGLDPEIGTNLSNSVDIGIDRGFYPQARSFVFGIDLTF